MGQPIGASYLETASEMKSIAVRCLGPKMIEIEGIDM